jgi:hypothetical protein
MLKLRQWLTQMPPESQRGACSRSAILRLPARRRRRACCAVDSNRKAKERSDELQLERGSDTADIFAIRASLPQGDLFSRSFSSEETISFSARDVDEPRDSLLAPRGSRDSLRSLLRDRPGSRGSLGDSFRGSLGDTVYVPSRRSDSTTSPPHPSKAKPWKPRSKPPPRTNFDDF